MDITKTQTLIEKKKEHQAYLEVEHMKLTHSVDAESDRKKALAAMIYADVLRVSAEIIDLKEGKLSDVNSESFAKCASNYYIAKLKETPDIQRVKRIDTIQTANFWTRIYLKFKNGGK